MPTERPDRRTPEELEAINKKRMQKYLESLRCACSKTYKQLGWPGEEYVDLNGATAIWRKGNYTLQTFAPHGFEETVFFDGKEWHDQATFEQYVFFANYKEEE